MYLPSTSKVCDEKGPRVVSKILTHFFASVCEQGGNLMCFKYEVSDRGDKIEKKSDKFLPISVIIIKSEKIHVNKMLAKFENKN